MRSLVSVLAVSLLAPLPAAAQELGLEFGVGGFYDSNFFASEEDPEGAYSYQVQPGFTLQERSGDLNWGLRYAPFWENYISDEAPSGWNHVVNGDVTWRIDRATRLQLSDYFSRTQSVATFNEFAVTPDGSRVPELEVGRRRFKYNALTGSLVRDLTPRTSLRLQGRHSLRDGDETQRGIQTAFASLFYLYALSETDTLGAGLGMTRQNFDAIGNVDETHTDFYNLSGEWEHRFSPTLQLTMSGGPTLVNSDPQDASDQASVVVATSQPGQPAVVSDGRNFFFVDADSCARLDDGTPFLPQTTATGGAPTLGVTGCQPVAQLLQGSLGRQNFMVAGVPSVDDSSVTFFADVALVKTFESWNFSLGYRREAASSTGFGTSSVVDVVTARTHWTPSARWTLDLNAYWSRQTQASDGLVFVTTVENQLIPVDTGFGTLNIPAAVPTGVRGLDVDNELVYDDYSTQFTVSYRLTRNLSLAGTLGFTRQKSEIGDASSEFDRYTAFITFKYEFDPIHL